MERIPSPSQGFGAQEVKAQLPEDNPSPGNKEALEASDSFKEQNVEGKGSSAEGLVGDNPRRTLRIIRQQTTEVGAEPEKAVSLGRDHGLPAEDGLIVDASGRPLSQKHGDRIAERFKPLTELELQTSRAELILELTQYRTAADLSVLQALKSSSLSEAQQNRILNVMAEIREHYVSQRGANGQINPEQKGSWLHAIGEMAEALENSRLNGLNGTQTQNSVLGCLFSDSVKSGWSKAQGGNFFTHHLDGAVAADVVLIRYEGDGFSKADRTHVVRAVLEHQISPPSFMGFNYIQQIRDGLNREAQLDLEKLRVENPNSLNDKQLARLKELSLLSAEYDARQAEILVLRDEVNPKANPEPAKLAKLRALEARQREGKFVSSEDSLRLQNIQKLLSNPYKAPLEADSLGGHRIAFSKEEKALMRRFIGDGVENWYVPHEKSPWYRESQVLITADALDNYFGDLNKDGQAVKGPFKIAALRGPTTVFADANINAAIASIRQSEQSALQLMNPTDRAVAERRMKDSSEVYRQALAATENFVRSELKLSPDVPLPTVPYFNADLLVLPLNSSAESKAAFAERSDVRFANKIQQFFADELLRMRRFDGTSQLELNPVRGLEEAVLRERLLKAEKSALPRKLNGDFGARYREGDPRDLVMRPVSSSPIADAPILGSDPLPDLNPLYEANAIESRESAQRAHELMRVELESTKLRAALANLELKLLAATNDAVREKLEKQKVDLKFRLCALSEYKSNPKLVESVNNDFRICSARATGAAVGASILIMAIYRLYKAHLAESNPEPKHSISR